jgi:hypothetical protein
MVEDASKLRQPLGLFDLVITGANAEFHKATIDNLPLEDGSTYCIISNCVINLAPDKRAVFREIARVLSLVAASRSPTSLSKSRFRLRLSTTCAARPMRGVRS